MPRSTSCANSAPIPVYGRLTPTLTSCACAQEVVSVSAAVAAAIIHLVMRVPPRRARMGRILWQEPETAQALGRTTRRRVLCDNARAGRGRDSNIRRTIVANFTGPGGGYKLEMEALTPIDAEIVEIAAKSDDDFVKEARDADALYAKGRRITKRIIDGLDRCKVIALGSVGVDSVDVAAATARGIPVTNVPDTFIEEVADHAMMLILATFR